VTVMTIWRLQLYISSESQDGHKMRF